MQRLHPSPSLHFCFLLQDEDFPNLQSKAMSLQFTFFLFQLGSLLGSVNSGRLETGRRKKGLAPSCSLPISISVTQATVLCASSSNWFQLWTSSHIPRLSLITLLRDISTS